MPGQDIPMRTYADEHLHDAYSGMTKNCGDFVMNVLRNGGLQPSSNVILPTIPRMMSIMSKRKSVAFFFLITLVHFALTVALLISGLSCGMQASCASSVSDVAAEVLAFPLNLVSLGLGGLGIDVDEVVRRYLGGEIVVIYLLNSLLAAAIIWFGAVDPLHRRKLQRRHRSA